MSSINPLDLTFILIKINLQTDISEKVIGTLVKLIVDSKHQQQMVLIFENYYISIIISLIQILKNSDNIPPQIRFQAQIQIPTLNTCLFPHITLLKFPQITL